MLRGDRYYFIAEVGLRLYRSVQEPDSCRKVPELGGVESLFLVWNNNIKKRVCPDRCWLLEPNVNAPDARKGCTHDGLG